MKTRVLFLLFFILFLISLLVYLLDLTGVINISENISLLSKTNPLIVEDRSYPTEVDKLELEKEREKLIELEETLATKEIDLENKENLLIQEQQEIKEIRKGIQEERVRLMLIARDLKDRRKKVQDLAMKIRNMPPEKAVKIMENWKHFQIIEVIRQIDTDFAREGAPSISPQLLTLFDPKESAEITRKMLLQPVELNNEGE